MEDKEVLGVTAQWEIRPLLGFGKPALERQITAPQCPTALRQPTLRGCRTACKRSICFFGKFKKIF